MPKSRTAQTYMDEKGAHAPGLDVDGIQRNFIWSPRFVTKVAAYTVTAKETGTWFLTTGATAAVTFTLPPLSDGPWIFFFTAVADIGMVVAGPALTSITFNDATATSVAYSTSSEIMGGTVIAICDGTTVVLLTPIISEGQTVTIVTS